jgi:CO/xanthine dehydrogenase Mo-binding subunit
VTGWTRNGKDVKIDYPPLDTDYSKLIDIACREIRWDRQPAARNEGRFAVGHGIGVSLRRGASFGDANARARLNADGSVTIEHNAPDVGEGAHTMISVVAAGTLGIPERQVHVAEPDTNYNLHFSGTSSQRTTIQMGNAVRLACEALQAEIFKVAASSLGGNAADWQIHDGRACRGDQLVELGVIAENAGGMIEAVGSYERSNRVDHAFGSRDHFAPGVAAVEVEVDCETGDVRVLKYAACADAGTVLNYSAAKGQIEGGAIMGFGAALFEEVSYGEGQLLNADAFQYRLPHLSDIPDGFSVNFIENHDGPGPFGSKGIAQTSIPCAAPAIANAIFDAVGARLTSTPFTPQKVLEAMGELKEKP